MLLSVRVMCPVLLSVCLSGMWFFFCSNGCYLGSRFILLLLSVRVMCPVLLSVCLSGMWFFFCSNGCYLGSRFILLLYVVIRK